MNKEVLISSSYSSENTAEVSNIDSEAGIIYGVKEASLGLNKNGYYFTEDLLSSLAEQGNAGEGIKARFGHPTQGLESLGTYIGRKKNFRIENGSLYADLFLDPLTKDTLVNGTSTFNFIIQMAKNNPDMLGCSVVFQASLSETEIEGETQLVPSLVKFTASDLVDEPAATDHLFNSKSINNSDMNKLQKAIEVLKLSFNTALETLNNEEAPQNEVVSEVVETLDTGLQVTIDTDETDIPKVGDAVTLTEGGEVAPDGVHVTASGLEIETEEGLIVSIKEEEAEEPVAEESVEEPAVEEVLENSVTLESLSETVSAIESKTAEFMNETTEQLVKALEVITAAGEARDLAFSEMKERQTVLASSIESKGLEFATKEVLPKSEKLNEVDAYLASRKK
tara:strand:+ start:435 stop:1619 length:1185 start_codon:yes stop_codon:yes gene_type:complete